MSSYPLRYSKNIIKFLNILNQLLDIYQTSPPMFFKQCLSNVSIDIYDKILELNGSKARSLHWSEEYIECIRLSKQITAAILKTERLERENYLSSLALYEQHYGNTMVTRFTVSTIISPIDF